MKKMTLVREVSMLILLFALTFIVILPIVCVDLGFSMYFVPSRVDKVTLDHENDVRVRKAKQTLKNFKESISFRESRRDGTRILDFVIVVVSVRRRSDPHYLLQSVARLLIEVQEDNGNSQIVVFNADEKPAENLDAEFLSQFVKVVSRSSALEVDNIFEKEKQDYVDALRAGLQQKSRFVLVVEDDALSTSGILWKLRFVLKWKMPWKWLKSGPRNWAFLKLYYPEKWQGFSNTEIPELLLIGVFGALIFVTFRVRLVKPRGRKPSTKILLLWCFFSFLYFLLVAYTVGRAHWIEMRKAVPLFYGVSKELGCCTPAVLFPSEEAQRFVQFLNRTKCRQGYPLDFAFEDFTNSNGLRGLLVSPNLFSHIGFHSSLHSYDKDPREFRLLFDPWSS